MTHSLYFKIVFKDYNDGLREFISEFNLAFTDRFEDILKELGAIWYYHLEGDDDVHLNEKQMLKKIND